MKFQRLIMTNSELTYIIIIKIGVLIIFVEIKKGSMDLALQFNIILEF